MAHDNTEIKLAQVRAFIEKHCVLTKQDERLLSRQGFRLGWLVDLRPAFLDGPTLSKIADEFWVQYRDLLPFQVAGMEIAAIPLVAAIVVKGNELGFAVNGIIIRKQRKRDGRGRLVEGIPNEHPVIVVDDTFNSGESLEKARIVLAAEELHVFGFFVVINYRAEMGQHWLEKTALPLVSLFDLPEFGLEVVRRKKAPLQQIFAQAWSFRSGQGSPYYVNPKSGLVGNAKQLFYGTERGALLCLNAEDGSKLWETLFPNTGKKGIWSTPALCGDQLFVGAYNGSFYCLDRETGSEIWQQELCEWIGSSPVCVADLDLVSIGLEYERTDTKGGIAAFSMSTGDKLWEYPLRQYQHGSSTYFAENKSLITGTNDHDVVSIDARSGRLNWRFETRRSVKYAPAVEPQRKLIAFASFDKSIYVVDATTGRKVAEIQTDGLCYTTPLITNGRLFCGSGDRNLYVLDLDTFKPIGRLDLKARVYAPPVLIDDMVVVGTTGGQVFFIDKETLQVRSQLVVPDSITNSVVASADQSMIFVPTCTSDIYGFRRLESSFEVSPAV